MNKKPDVVQEQNNATITMMGNYLPIKDLECMDEEQEIWRGVPMPHSGMQAKLSTYVFFSRRYEPDVNDWDTVYKEIEFTDTTIAGVVWYLIPKDKILFGYEPPTTQGIIKPDIIPFNSRNRK